MNDDKKEDEEIEGEEGVEDAKMEEENGEDTEESMTRMIDETVRNVFEEECHEKISIQRKDLYNLDVKNDTQEYSIKLKHENGTLFVGLEPFETWLSRIFA